MYVILTNTTEILTLNWKSIKVQERTKISNRYNQVYKIQETLFSAGYSTTNKLATRAIFRHIRCINKHVKATAKREALVITYMSRLHTY